MRYPVKGFNGQDLPAVTVRRGGGLPYDRRLAVTNATVSVEPGGGWTACRAFVRLTKNAELPRYTVNFAPGAGLGQDSETPVVLRLVPPTGREAVVRWEEGTVRADDLTAADEVLAGWFPHGPLGPPRLVTSEHGLWDHQDAVLSMINLETVADLSAAAGQLVDPLRFRANLYLSGLQAWSELALVGRRIRLGEVELEVLRPTDRCRATAVDPETADTSLNVPALLAANYGHLYCGVYARVINGGRLVTGQELLDVGPAPAAVPEAAMASTAPPPAQWPRYASVTEVVQDSATVRSLWLRDPLNGVAPPPLPGQHLRVHAADPDGPLWRSYTVSAVDGDRLRISVRDAGEEARMSRLLHRTAPTGPQLLISGPFGGMSLDPAGTGPVVLVSAGIGITPMVAMLRALTERRSPRSVVLWHVARDHADLALWAEARAYLDQLPSGQARLFLTRTPPATPGADGSDGPAGSTVEAATAGRPQPAALTALVRSLAPGPASVYLCGPPAFLMDMRAAALAGGMAPAAVHHEVFTSPRPAAGRFTPPPLPGPFQVRFALGGDGAAGTADLEATWRAQDGSLLDTAEAAGLTLPAGCRAGACGSCAQIVTTGSTAYRTEPVLAPAAPAVLLCCAVPTSDITIRT